MNTDWDAARLSIQSKLTQYHQMKDKGNDEAIRLERAVLEDAGRLSGKEVNVAILDEEGARLMIERGEELKDRGKFEEFADQHSGDIAKMMVFIQEHGDELNEISKLSKKLGLTNGVSLEENRTNLFKRAFKASMKSSK